MTRLALPEPLRKLWAVSFVRFLFVGGLNTLFGYGVFAFFVLIGLHYALAALLGTLLGILFNFKTTGTIVFRSHDNRLILRFLGVYAVTYVLGVLVLKVFKALGVHVLITAAVGTLPMAVVSFLLMRRFVFRDSRTELKSEVLGAFGEMTGTVRGLLVSPSESTLVQFFRYAFVGGLAFLVDFGVLYALTEFAGVHYLLSATLSFLAGLAVNYLLSIVWVFAGHKLRSRWVEFGIFALVGVVGLGLNDLFMWLFTGVIGLYFVYSKLISTVLVFLWNFFARKLSLFR